MIILVIVSITKFSIVIGHPRAISCVISARSRGCPITTFCKWTLASRTCQSVALKWVLLLIEITKTFWVQRRPHGLFHLEFCYLCDYLVIELRFVKFWDNHARNFKADLKYSPDYSLNCTPLSPITITCVRFKGASSRVTHLKNIGQS